MLAVETNTHTSMIALVILLKSRIDAVDLHERKVGGGRNVR